MQDYPPLPVEFEDTSVLRIRAEKWKHLDYNRRMSFLRNCMIHLIGWKRRNGYLFRKRR